MGQKTHPTGFRVGIIQKWASSWFAKVKDYREFVAEDAKIRKFVKKFQNTLAKKLLSMLLK